MKKTKIIWLSCLLMATVGFVGCGIGSGNSESSSDNSSDSGTVHTHTYEEQAGTDATCTTEGVEAHYTCEGCESLFVKNGTEYVETTLDALKIEKTSHNINGITIKTQPTKTTYGAYETFDVTGMVVEADCETSGCEGVVLDNTDLTVVYQTEGATALKVGDTKVTVKYGEFSADVSVVVEKTTVVKPEADSTVFTYTGLEQTYGIAESTQYIISGNKQTGVGEYTVTVALVDKETCTWADGTTEDLTYPFNIAKATNEITSLTCEAISCHGTPTPSVTASFGADTVVYSVKKNGDADFVSLQDCTFTEGTYELKATIAETGNYSLAEQTIELNVQHEMAWSSDSTSYGCICGVKEINTVTLTAKHKFAYEDTAYAFAEGNAISFIIGDETKNREATVGADGEVTALLYNGEYTILSNYHENVKITVENGEIVGASEFVMIRNAVSHNNGEGYTGVDDENGGHLTFAKDTVVEYKNNLGRGVDYSNAVMYLDYSTTDVVSDYRFLNFAPKTALNDAMQTVEGTPTQNASARYLLGAITNTGACGFYFSTAATESKVLTWAQTEGEETFIRLFFTFESSGAGTKVSAYYLSGGYDICSYLGYFVTANEVGGVWLSGASCSTAFSYKNVKFYDGERATQEIAKIIGSNYELTVQYTENGSEPTDFADGTEITFTSENNVETKATVAGGKVNVTLKNGVYTIAVNYHSVATITVENGEVVDGEIILDKQTVFEYTLSANHKFAYEAEAYALADNTVLTFKAESGAESTVNVLDGKVITLLANGAYTVSTDGHIAASLTLTNGNVEAGTLTLTRKVVDEASATGYAATNTENGGNIAYTNYKPAQEFAIGNGVDFTNAVMTFDLDFDATRSSGLMFLQFLNASGARATVTSAQCHNGTAMTNVASPVGLIGLNGWATVQTRVYTANANQSVSINIGSQKTTNPSNKLAIHFNNGTISVYYDNAGVYTKIGEMKNNDIAKLNIFGAAAEANTVFSNIQFYDGARTAARLTALGIA